jgi:hypothetical protein
MGINLLDNLIPII